MIKKTKLWVDCMNNNKTELFPSLHDFFCVEITSLWQTVSNATLQCTSVSWLHNCAGRLLPRNWWVGQLDSVSLFCCACFLTASEQESLIEVATSGSIQIRLNQKSYPEIFLEDFWIGLCTEYPALAKCAVKTLKPFVITYLCESGFSVLTSMTTKYRHRLCVEDDIRLRLSPIQPDIAKLCASSQAHKSH